MEMFFVIVVIVIQFIWLLVLTLLVNTNKSITDNDMLSHLNLVDEVYQLEKDLDKLKADLNNVLRIE